MFSSLFTAAPLTAFESSLSLKAVNLMLISLFAKETELKTAADAFGTSSIDYRKYNYINDLCTSIRQLLNEFNQDAQQNQTADDKEKIITLTQKLYLAVTRTLSDFGTTISAHRQSERREVGRKVIGLATDATIAAPAAVLGHPYVSVGIAAAALTGVSSPFTSPIKNGIFSMVGLSKEAETATLKILKSLQIELEQVSQNLGVEQSLLRRQAKHEKDLCPNSFYCPITQALMSDPVIDKNGDTYERSAIMLWINEHGTSPMTREPLSSSDLMPNRAIRDAIDDYLKSNPARMEKHFQPQHLG